MLVHLVHLEELGKREEEAPLAMKVYLDHQAEMDSLKHQLNDAMQAATRLTAARDEAVASSLKARAETMRARADAEREASELREELSRAHDAVGQVRATAEAGPSDKVKALSQMVREQQSELTDGYRLSAALKLGSSIDKRASLALAAAWARPRMPPGPWRGRAKSAARGKWEISAVYLRFPVP